jgi:hypothetical protein
MTEQAAGLVLPQNVPFQENSTQTTEFPPAYSAVCNDTRRVNDSVITQQPTSRTADTPLISTTNTTAPRSIISTTCVKEVALGGMALTTGVFVGTCVGAGCMPGCGFPTWAALLGGVSSGSITSLSPYLFGLRDLIVNSELKLDSRNGLQYTRRN